MNANQALARKAGICSACNRSFAVGAPIGFLKVNGGWRPVHAACAPTRPDPVRIDASAIQAMFQRAATHLKHPKVVVEIEGVRLQFQLAGERSRYCGSVMVTDGERYPNNTWFGAISPAGAYVPTDRATEQTVALVRRFAADPEECASAHGRLTGNCCFCRKKLEDERSTAVGYGPVCARHFGLAWGTRRLPFPPSSADPSTPPTAQSAAAA